MLAHNWEQFAFIFSNVGDDQKCNIMNADIQVGALLFAVACFVLYKKVNLIEFKIDENYLN